jgi:hypothetical protein
VEQQATQILDERRTLREELEVARAATTKEEVKEVLVDNSKEIQEVQKKNAVSCY